MIEPERTILSSPANPRIRHLIRMRDNRARRRAGRIVVDGWRETSQAVEAGLTLCGLYVAQTRNPETTGEATNAVTMAQQLGCQFEVTDSILSKISYGQAARGVVAEFEAPPQDWASLQVSRRSVILVLDQIEKPGNVGAVFRSADAAGIDAVLLCDCACDRFNPNAIRASLGAVFRVPAAAGNVEEVSEFLTQHAIQPLAARVESSRSLWELQFPQPVAIVLGSEADGLSDRWTRFNGEPIGGIRIPMAGQIDSLNISVSAAVIAFEAARQRENRPKND